MPSRLFLSLLAAAAAAAAPSPSPPPAPDYAGVAKTYLDGADAAWPLVLSKVCLKKPPPGAAPLICNSAASLASAHAAWWRHTGDASHLATASSLLQVWVASYRHATRSGAGPNADATDFFACAPAAGAVYCGQLLAICVAVAGGSCVAPFG